MNLRGCRPRTQDSYLGCIGALARYYNLRPDKLSNDEARSFLQSQVDKGLAAATLKVYLNALVCYYRDHLGRDTEGIFDVLPKNRKQRKCLPKFYSRSEILRLLESTDRRCQRLYLMLVYSCGLRLCESINLRWRDINFACDSVFVDCGKGGKDRYMPLSRTLKSYLKMHYKEAFSGALAASDYVFESGQSRRNGKTIASGTGQQWYERALVSSGISRRGGIHCLRHSYATHQLELGVDIRRLKELMGHEHINTTMVYLHCVPSDMNKCASPLDSLNSDCDNGFGGLV